MPLDARIEAKKLMDLYKEDPLQSHFNLLLLGEKGSGKTSLLRTARFPLHIDSWDPGGTIVLRDLIEKGDIVADTRYESENPKKPVQYTQWLFQMEQRINGGYFNSFQTYCLDSMTPFGDAIIYWLQHTVTKDVEGKSRAGETPQWNRDYRPQRTQVENVMRMLLSLPCDVIVTGHLTGEYEKKFNGITNTMEDHLVKWVFNGVGETKKKVPTFFSEMWIATRKEAPKQDEFEILTQTSGFYHASTRIGRDGRFNKWEKPDIKALLRKAGWSTADKPPLYEVEKGETNGTAELPPSARPSPTSSRSGVNSR